MTKSDRWKKRPVVMKYWAFKDQVKLKGIEMPEEARIIFYIPMPDSWSKKKKEQYLNQPHTQTPDVDNLLKGLMDAVFDDDAHIWNVHVTKLWGQTGQIHIGQL